MALFYVIGVPSSSQDVVYLRPARASYMALFYHHRTDAIFM